jgi:hypothetical protein
MAASEVISSIAQILGAIAWPATAVAGGVVFRSELRALLGRVRKGPGLEFDPIPQINVTAANALPVAAPADAALQLPRTPATIVWEQTIRDYPPLRQIADPAQREAALILFAARALLMVQFEQVDNAIWASQLALLNHLNAKPNGESLSMLRQYYYEPATKVFPDWFANYPFEGYMGFLLRNILVEQVGDSVRITDRGMEYLRWRIEQHRPVKLHG